MKAILVIDVEEKYIGSFGTEIEFINRKYNCNWKIKQIPQKKQHEEEIDYDYGYIDGWNDCLQEIENESNISDQ